MVDFLNNLIARSRRNELTIEPRPVARYETPVVGLVETLTDTELASESPMDDELALEASNDLKPKNPALRKTRKQTQSKMPAVGLQSPTVSPVEIHLVQPEIETIPIVPASQANFTQEKVEDLSEARPVEPPTAKTTADKIAPPAAPPTLPVETNTAPDRAIAPYQVPLPEKQDNATLLEDDRAINAVEIKTESTASQPNPPAWPNRLPQNEPIAVQPSDIQPSDIQPVDPARIALESTVAPLGAPPSPSIQVTIGRIEVKAQQAARPQLGTTPAKAKSPVMSLTDYLKHRNGGDE